MSELQDLGRLDAAAALTLASYHIQQPYLGKGVVWDVHRGLQRASHIAPMSHRVLSHQI